MGLFPRLDELSESTTIFRPSFGLNDLPKEPGLIVIRGPRQFGKSTWLEEQLRETVRQFGGGTAYFIDGDHVRDADELQQELIRLASSFEVRAPVRRIFIDEITAITDWERGIKRVIDRGLLRQVLVVTTGSRASDLRHGSERLPGRKGKLARTNYLFLPISYSEFCRAGGQKLGADALPAYLLSGGSPMACKSMIEQGWISEWIVETTRDWILGEVSLSGRARHALVAIMEKLHNGGGSPIGQTKLARDAGLANNTVAAGWIDLLTDLLCVTTQAAWDASKRVEITRRPAKFPFVNLLAATAWAPERPRSVTDYQEMKPERQGVWLEWLVGQELYRRASIAGEPEPERLRYWQGDQHELDFVQGNDMLVEVKRGQASALEFAWFPRLFPKKRLTVVCNSMFETDSVIGMTPEAFLVGGKT